MYRTIAFLAAALLALSSTALAQPVGDQPSGDQPSGDQPSNDQPSGDRPVAGTTSAGPAAPKAAPATAAHRPGPVSSGELRVLFTSDIYGWYAWPGCDRNGAPPAGKADLAHLAAAVKARKEAAARDNAGFPLVLSAGSVVRPDILGAHLFGDSDATASSAAGLLAAVGFDALSVGLFDFGADPKVLSRYMSAMRSRNVPLLAANVTCEEDTDFRCKNLGLNKKRYLVIPRNGLRVGVFSVVRGDLTGRIVSKAVGSIKTADPLETTRELVKLLRAGEKVDLVVLLANLNIEDDAAAETVRFARRLGADAPDLIVTNTLYNRRGKDFIETIRVNGGPQIVGTDRFGQHLGEARIRFHRTGAGTVVDGVDVSMHRTAEATPEPKHQQTANALLSNLCKEVNRPLGKATIKQEMSYKQFRAYVMEILRKVTGAEIVFLNDSALADTGFPIKGPITKERILRSIRTESHLGTFRMQPAALTKKLCFPYVLGDQPGLQVFGLARKENKKWYINNRLAIGGHHYKVASTRFVAEGGDGLFSLWTEQFADSGKQLRQAVVEFFQNDGPSHDGDPAVERDKDFDDPWNKFLFYAGFNVGASVSNVAVSNISTSGGTVQGSRTAAYRYSGQPLLNRDNQTAVAFDVSVEGGASDRNHALEADLNLQYGHSWTTTQASKLTAAGDVTQNEQVDSAETLDRVRFDLLYLYTGWRNAEVPALWYMPVPYAEVTVLSEFTDSGTYTTDAGVTDTYHYLDLGGTVGVGMLPHPFLLFKAGFALAGELLTPDEVPTFAENKARMGLFLGYKLRRMKLNKSIYHPIQLESRLDFFVTDLGDTNRKELTWESKLFLAVVPMINLTASHRLYVFDTASADVSVANDIMFGVDFLYDYRHQLL